MKKLFLITCAIAVAGMVHAALYDVVTVPVANVTTNTNAASATVVYRSNINGGMDGKIVMLSFSGSTNMHFAVETVDELGMSMGGARTVQSVVTNTMGTNIVLGTAVYVSNDKLKCSFYGSSNTNGTATATLKLLLEVK